ncbi:MAG TPA: hypothetical protein DCL77_12290 [Prolixibacteraceae bacterium]|jgi:hypothetical protein|nr:hypothetical protein [Prolixibacteraceae bacterium]
MKTNFVTLFIGIIFLSIQAVQAESKVLLRLNLQKGTKYEMTMDMDNAVNQTMMGKDMKISQKMVMVFTYHILEVLPNKNFLMEYSISHMKMNMVVNEKEMNFDSQHPDTLNPMSGLFKGLFYDTLKLELSPRGQVERVEGLEEYVKKISQNPMMAQAMQMFSSDKSFKSFVGQTFNYFPESEVAQGDKWTSTFTLPAMMNMEAVMNFEVAAIEKDQTVLNVLSDINVDGPFEQNGMKFNIKMTGTQHGSMTIDSNDGWFRLSDLTQKMDLTMKMKNPQTGEDLEIPMLMNSVAIMTVVKK